MFQNVFEIQANFKMNSVRFTLAAATATLVVLSALVGPADSRLHNNNGSNNYKERMETLTTKLISSIGIDKVPDYKNANISFEEYDRMFKVYQKSVEQTELLRDLRQSLEQDGADSTDFETKKLHLAPSGLNRAKRSSFVNDYFYGDSNEAKAAWDESSLFLTFLNKKLEDEDKKDALLVVESAKLHVTLIRSSSEEADDETVVTLTLIQLTEDNGYETGITVDRIHVKACDVGTRKTIEYDVTSTVQAWLIKSEDNHGFQLICHKCDEAGVTFDDVGGDTWLEVNGRDSSVGAGWRRVGHRRRSAVGAMSNSTPSPLLDAIQASQHHKRERHAGGKTDCKAMKGKRGRCCRQKMQVDLRDIPGFDFIQQPTTFDAHICMGRCPPRYNPTNDHSLLQSLMHLKTQHLDKADRIPRPCCAPTKMEPLDILHIDENDPTRLRVTHWKNVVVGECACA